MGCPDTATRNIATARRTVRHPDTPGQNARNPSPTGFSPGGARVKTLVIVRTRDPHRQAEALRAALGLTLRGATVEVVVDGELLTPLARRAAETLRSFGHTVGSELHLDADAIEVWT